MDTDGDTLNDKQELNIIGTNPLSQDTDGDGINDNIDDFPLTNITQSISEPEENVLGSINIGLLISTIVGRINLNYYQYNCWTD